MSGRFWGSKDNKYHGLINQGSTCYLNSVLQVLFMTKEFRNAVERHTCENPDTECIDQHLTALFHDLKTHAAHTVEITNKLGITKVYEQRDAAEHFEKIVTLASREASKIFQGQLTHKTTCTGCGIVTEEDEPFWNLPLALVDSSTGGEDYCVDNGINQFFKDSEMSGANQMYCDECDAKCDATIKCEMKHHPDVLMLLLKRFEFSYRSMSYAKIRRVVDVPYTLQIPERQTYELYAFVEHSGSLRNGHYTATIKCQDESEDRWYNFNDTSVTWVDLQMDVTERSRSAYLLFYRKQKMSATDAGTQDTREVFTSEGPPLTTSDNHVQDTEEKDEGEDTEEKAGGEDTVEVGNDAAVAASIDRNEETAIKDKVNVVSRGGELSPECNVEAQDSHQEKGADEDTEDQVENRELLCNETQLKESVKHEESTGLDEVREGTPGHLDKQAEMGDAQRRVVETEKDGKTGDNEQGDAERMGEENEKAGADNSTSRSDKHDSPKYVEDRTRGSDIEPSMPMNEQGREEGITMHTRYEPQGERREDAQGDNEQKREDSQDVQRRETSMTKPHLSEGGEEQDMRDLEGGRDSEKISVSCTTQKHVSVEKHVEKQENAEFTEEIQMEETGFLRQVGSETEGRLTENQGAGSDEKMRLSKPKASNESETRVQDTWSEGDCKLSESKKYCAKRCNGSVEEESERNTEPDSRQPKEKQKNQSVCCLWFSKKKKNRQDMD